MWVEKRIGDLGSIVTGNTPPTKNRDYYGYKYKLIKPTDMTEGLRYVNKTEEMLSDFGYERYKKSIIPANTPCVVTIGSLGKKLCLTNEPSFTNQAVNAIVVNKENDGRFIYFLMKLMLPTVKHLSSGTASGRENVSKSSFANIQVRVPPLLIQQKIAELLSAYEDIIENNSRRIELLEQAAQQLYKEWFVRFRFPGYESLYFTKGIPNGWEVVKLEDVIEFLNGKVAKNMEADGYPVYGSNGIIGYSKNALYENGIILGRVGAYCGSVELCTEKFWASDNTIVVKSKQTANIMFCYYLLIRMNLNMYAGGAAQPLITQSVLKKIKILLPPLQLQNVFNDKVNIIYEQIRILQTKNQNLIKQRDLLLPRLMSGKIEV
jgi:type I restriction enzyme S subunit